MNGFHFLVFAAAVFGAVYFIPRAIRFDQWAFEMDNLDDEELDAVLAEFPDWLSRGQR